MDSLTTWLRGYDDSLVVPDQCLNTDTGWASFLCQIPKEIIFRRTVPGYRVEIKVVKKYSNSELAKLLRIENNGFVEAAAQQVEITVNRPNGNLASKKIELIDLVKRAIGRSEMFVQSMYVFSLERLQWVPEASILVVAFQWGVPSSDAGAGVQSLLAINLNTLALAFNTSGYTGRPPSVFSQNANTLWLGTALIGLPSLREIPVRYPSFDMNLIQQVAITDTTLLQILAFPKSWIDTLEYGDGTTHVHTVSSWHDSQLDDAEQQPNVLLLNNRTGKQITSSRLNDIRCTLACFTSSISSPSYFAVLDIAENDSLGSQSHLVWISRKKPSRINRTLLRSIPQFRRSSNVNRLERKSFDRYPHENNIPGVTVWMDTTTGTPCFIEIKPVR